MPVEVPPETISADISVRVAGVVSIAAAMERQPAGWGSRPRMLYALNSLCRLLTLSDRVLTKARR
jgi:hypothetical protein